MPNTVDLRHAPGRLILEVELLRGEIASIKRRDRSRLTPDECRRLEALLERKLTRLREVQQWLTHATSLSA
jgi:hypothetical protein